MESEILLYTTPNGDVRIDVLYQGENIWLTQKKMAELFGVNIRTISEHLQNIFASQELDKNSVIRIFRNTASERGFYQKITDIYAECSADYDPTSEITKQFYSKVQNKLHWAIHGLTAAELIHSRVSHKKPFIGLRCTVPECDGEDLA
ncbi:RhuM family protein [Wolbachia endosymbiont of Oedothorax gibbosus]|uniref:RhuM family protein n=1 Tax=Wolbachia endosymbiont of Oedothorax gibbosus TaxID=931100 RepID=UPI0020255287|nr:RhuM family protein [Wolbachia endosymbiont of Oedothorax gibbosus]